MLGGEQYVPELLADKDCELALAAEAMRDYARYAARAVSPDDLSFPTARLVTDTCAAIWEAGEAVSLTAVATHLQRVGKLSAVGGLRGLADIAAVDAVPDHERIRALAALRRLKEAGMEVVRAASKGDLSRAVEALSGAEKAVHGSRVRKVRPMRDAVEDLLESLRDPSKAAARRVHPGLQHFHTAFGYAPVGGVVTIGAPTNVGKSSVALEMLIACAQRNVKGGLISVEDPDDVTAGRALGAFAGVSSRSIQHGRITADQMPALSRAVSEINLLGDKLMLADCTGETELEVMAAMSQMAASGARIVVVDYIQEIEASKPQQDRRNDVRWIAKRLKAHARRIGVALVLISQLKRLEDSGKRPTKQDLKEAGDLENSSEVVILLWRTEEDDSAPVKAWLAKCKWGGVGQWWEMQRQEGSGRLVEIGSVHSSLKSLNEAPSRRGRAYA